MSKLDSLYLCSVDIMSAYETSLIVKVSQLLPACRPTQQLAYVSQLTTPMFPINSQYFGRTNIAGMPLLRAAQLLEQHAARGGEEALRNQSTHAAGAQHCSQSRSSSFAAACMSLVIVAFSSGQSANTHPDLPACSSSSPLQTCTQAPSPCPA